MGDFFLGLIVHIVVNHCTFACQKSPSSPSIQGGGYPKSTLKNCFHENQNCLIVAN
jgi:hypothetical protein